MLMGVPGSASPPLIASLTERLREIHAGSDLPAALLDARVERVSLRDGGEPLLVVRPDDWPALRAAEQDADHPVPYWAVPWPSGLALARALAADPPAPGTRVLELGCGLALPSLVAARAGAQVVATDGSRDAAVYAAHTLALNQVEADVLPGDWRDAADQLAERPFELVLAADVLYLRENVDALLELLPRFVAPGGTILLADPGRAGTTEFMAEAEAIWSITRTVAPDDERITLYHLRLRAE